MAHVASYKKHFRFVQIPRLGKLTFCWRRHSTIPEPDIFHFKLFSVFFALTAFLCDIFCYIFIPVQWLLFASSTYVWVQYVWHTGQPLAFAFNLRNARGFILYWRYRKRRVLADNYAMATVCLCGSIGAHEKPKGNRLLSTVRCPLHRVSDRYALLRFQILFELQMDAGEYFRIAQISRLFNLCFLFRIEKAEKSP